MVQNNSLDDRYLFHVLNPFLLETLRQYWHQLSASTIPDDQKAAAAEAKYNLIRFAFREMFKSAYTKYKLKEISGKIFLLSAIHTDGIGDYMQLLKCAKLVKEQYPQAEVHVVYTHKQQLPEVQIAQYLLKNEHVHAFFETEDLASKVLEPVLEGHSIETTNSEILKLYEMMKESLAIIHIALAINTFDNPALAPQSMFFAEAGNFQGIGNYLQRNWFSMGLDFFEEGINLRTDPIIKEWENKDFADFLWGNRNPAEKDYANYFKTTTLQVGYLPRIVHQKEVFIDLVCHLHKTDNRDIDIILPKNQEDEDKKYSKEWMEKYGLSKVISVDSNEDYIEKVKNEIELPLSKTLRIIYALPMPSVDFIKLIHLAGEVIGCTGDGSLSDCIIAGKIPFYEVRRHKRRVAEAFIQISKKLALNEVADYFTNLLQLSDNKMLSVEPFLTIHEGSFKVQWNTLLKFIRRYYSLENSFLAQLNRQLFISQYPDIKNREDLLARDFFENTLNAEEALITFEQILKQRV